MTDTTTPIRRRTVLQRAAAGVGGAVALGAAGPVGEASAATCVVTITLADAWLDACPLAGDADDVPEDEYGTAYEECFGDGTYWLHVDWDNYPHSWVSEEDIDYC